MKLQYRNFYRYGQGKSSQNTQVNCSTFDWFLKIAPNSRSRSQFMPRVRTVGTDTQHTTTHTQHPTPNTQHPTPNTQHTTHNTQHTKHNTQHTTHNTQHTKHNTQNTTHQNRRIKSRFLAHTIRNSTYVRGLIFP
jgi:hypothetical protein